MARFSNARLDRNKILSKSGSFISDYQGVHVLGPVQKGGSGNTIINSGSGDYDGGDRVIGGHCGYDIDGDLLFTVGWGDGFAVRRLNNDGTMTRLFFDSNFLWRDTGSTYNHLTSVALDKVNKLGVVMSYNVYGYTTFNYSGLMNGGTTFVKDPRPSHSNPQFFIGSQDTSNGYVRRVGYWYAGGLCAAGEWIYASEHDARHYKKFPRRNLNTGEEQILESAATAYPGSAVNDRNGYRGSLSYDEVNDRMYYFDYEGNGGFTVILDASTDNPKSLWCDLEDTVSSSNPKRYATNGYIREPGLFVPNPNSEPDIVWMGGYNSILHVDYTPCYSGQAPALLNIRSLSNIDDNTNVADGYLRVGSKYQKTVGTPTDKLPGSKNFMFVGADRGWAMTDNCYHDIAANATYAFRRRSDYSEDTAGRGTTFQSDYGMQPVMMTSANGTNYWVRMGYGSDGHSFKVWPEDVRPMELMGDWSMKFGNYTLDNNANIDMVFIHGISDFKIPPNCIVTVRVSNNGGSTWEVYNSLVESHVFGSTGNSLQVEIIATGFSDSAPFRIESTPLMINYSSLHEVAKRANVKFKIPRKRLR
jgi:hypothetical protein